MSSYSDFLKQVKENNIEWFFPNHKKESNKYFTFSHYISNDEIVLITSNLIYIKGNSVMIIGNNKGVYLKDFNIRPVHNYDLGINTYAVRLKRDFFKVYTFKNNFIDFSFEKEETFDDLVEIAKKQDETNLKIAIGHMKKL